MKNQVSFMGLFFLVQIFLLLFFIGQTIFFFHFYVMQIENSFIKNTQQINLHAATLTKTAAQKQDYTFLTEAYISLINNSQEHTSLIAEVFFLTPDGFIKAHNDFSEVDEKVSKYHNNFFQKVLQIKDKEILQQNYILANLPSPTSLPLAKILLSKDIAYSQHSSTPVYANNKAIGSVHVIANRNYLNALLPMLMQNSLIFLFASFVWGTFLTVALYNIFTKRSKSWQGKEIKEQKTLQKSQEETTTRKKQTKEKHAEDIVEAIFIED